MTDHWTDRIVGDRMAVDQEFSDRVAASDITRQQWGLVMTAVEFEIDRAGEKPQIVADTSDLQAVVPQLESMPEHPGAMGAEDREESGGGVVTGLLDKLGLGSDETGFGDQELETAKQLTQEYATQLQARLEEKGTWADVCEAEAADQ